MANWEHFSHGADIGVRGFGESLEQAFEQAALSLSAIVADPSAIAPLDRVDVHCDAPDVELLLVSWLNAIIYEMAVRKMLFSNFCVTISGPSLSGSMFGEKLDPERHQPGVEPKGATVTALHVECEQSNRWVAQCVVDV